MAEMLVVKSKVKEVCKEFNVSSDFIDQLNEDVLSLVQDACVRAKANGRKTVQGRDL